MNSKEYLVLNSWLQKADQNYIGGRILWFKLFIDQASNLLWLSLEQIIKILLLQKIICDSAQDKNLDILHKEYDREAKTIGHNVKKLIEAVDSKYPQINIKGYEDLLNKLQEYFFRRYVVRGSSSINLKQIERIDELYFMLRELVDSEVGLGTIDEIFIQKKRGSGHPLSSYKYAYHNNKYFRTREHREMIFFTLNGERFKENGT